MVARRGIRNRGTTRIGLYGCLALLGVWASLGGRGESALGAANPDGSGSKTVPASSSDTPAANRVLSLDGKAGYVRVGDSASLDSFNDAITIEAWFQASSFYTGMGNVNSILRKNIAEGQENYMLRFRCIDGQPWVEMNASGAVGVVRASHPFAPGQWYHLAGTYDGKTMTVYVNGVQTASEKFAGPMYVDQSDLYIGKGDPEYSFGEYFHGALDEIRLWNVARSPRQIQEAMNASLTGKEEGLVAYWNFDDGTARDLSGHGNDGSLQEGARIGESPRPTVTVPTGQATVAATELTTEQRRAVLEALWQNLSEIYPALEYKGISGREWIEPALKKAGEVKSDEEFYGVLLEQMAGLNDTHTRIQSYPGQPRGETPPVVLNVVEGKVAVIRAPAGMPLSPGDILLAIDGRPVQECLTECMSRISNSTPRGRTREACGQLLRGAPGTTAGVTIQGSDGTTRQVSLRRELRTRWLQEAALSSRTLGDSLGYIRISRWSSDSRDRDLAQEFDRVLEEFKDTKGLVIDVRGNGGGDDQLADRVNGRLTDRPVLSSIDFWRRAGSDQYEKTLGWVQPRGPWTYKGRVAVLIDEGCASACEHFVSGIEAMGHVLLVGAPTNGAGGGPTQVKLPDGTQVSISRALGLRANGVVFEGHGIPPHILVTPTLADLRAGRDAALEIARDWIRSNQDVPARTQSLPGSKEEHETR
jgi:C-terminal processing protease CtpA/Prc